MHESAPPAAGVHPGVVLVRFMVSGATIDVGATPLTFMSTTSTDCIAVEAPDPAGGTKIENDALPLDPDCGTVVPPPPLHAVLIATKTTAADRQRAKFLIHTFYTIRPYRNQGTLETAFDLHVRHAETFGLVRILQASNAP